MSLLCKKGIKMHFLSVFSVFIVGFLASFATTACANDLKFLNLLEGFEIDIWAEVPGARTLVMSPDGQQLYVGTRSSRVYRVDIDKRTQNAVSVSTFKSGLKVANGIDLDPEGQLVIAEQHRIIRINNQGDIQELVPAGLLPNSRHHGWRYAKFGPDGAFYVAVGAPCNICKIDGVEGTILRFDPKTWQHTVHASGIRNSVGFDWNADGIMFFTDNGGDNLGDNIPPDELNMLTKPGLHYGYPYFYGKGGRYPQFEHAKSIPKPTHTLVDFDAHVAALGIDFYGGGQFPDKYQNTAFVAQHGSWNRTDPIGYRVMAVQNLGVMGEPEKSVFIDGWLGQNGEVRGRPVDLEELPDGSLLISDDYRDVIYRVRYTGD